MSTTTPTPRPGVPVLPAADAPAGLCLGAGLAAFFGTLWFVQGAAAAAGPLAAAAALLPGLALAAVLRRTRCTRPGRAGRAVDHQAHRAERWISRATAAQLSVSTLGGVAVQLLLGRAAVVPFVVLTVGVHLLVLAPVVRRAHLWVAGALLTVVPVLTWTTLEGAGLTAATGLGAGGVFLAKGAADLVAARRT